MGLTVVGPHLTRGDEVPGRKRGRLLRGCLLVGAGVLTADLLAIAAAYAVTTKFPRPLRLIQEYPWWSVAIFIAIGVVLVVWLYLSDNSHDADASSRESGNDEVKVADSMLKRSVIWVVKGTHVGIAGSKLKDSSVVVSSDRRDDPTPGSS